MNEMKSIAGWAIVFLCLCLILRGLILRSVLQAESVKSHKTKQQPVLLKLFTTPLSRDSRIICLIWLFVAAVIMAIGWWYPYWLLPRRDIYDDRAGFAMIVAVPFDLLAIVIGASAGLRLRRSIRESKKSTNVLIGFVGVVLAVIALLPAVVIIPAFLFLFTGAFRL